MFQPGCKAIVSCGAREERCFVTAVVLNDDVGGGGEDGWIVLERSLIRDHPEGVQVTSARPGKAEAAGYRRRQVGIEGSIDILLSAIRNAVMPCNLISYIVKRVHRGSAEGVSVIYTQKRQVVNCCGFIFYLLMVEESSNRTPRPSSCQ